MKRKSIPENPVKQLQKKEDPKLEKIKDTSAETLARALQSMMKKDK